MIHLPVIRLDPKAALEDYLACILWSENDNSDESGGDPLDKNYVVGDFNKRSVKLAVADLKKFYQAVDEAFLVLADQAMEQGRLEQFEGEVLEITWNLVGHDFWLSRVGHGTGFFDREDHYGPFTEILQRVSRNQGERYTYVQRGKVGIE